MAEKQPLLLKCSSRSSSPALQGALLIKAHSRIVELEAEVSQLKQEAAVERVKQEMIILSTKSTPVTDLERQHKLEQERAELVEKLTEVKASLTEAEKQLEQANKKYQMLSERYEADTGALKTQVENIMEQMMAMDSLTDEMQGELNQSKLLECESQHEQVEELKESYSRAIQGLQQRLAHLESVESKLLSSQAQVEHLQHQLSLYRQDSHFIHTMKKQLVHLEGVERQLQLAKKENQALRQDRTNADLLRYQVQSLQQAREQLASVKEELAMLKIENRQLRVGGGYATAQNTPSSALQIQLAELQQREVISLKKFGELSTQFKVCEEELKLCQSQLQESEQKLVRANEVALLGQEKIQRLERRLMFVMKERDGCVNVLNSYKLDSGVDGLMKELLAEKERELERSQAQIIELEAELENKRQSNT